jgi:eukaryotic-like serine/threonine-protein kinase
MAEVPSSFGKYYLTEKLAAGGMAEIYLGKLMGPGGFEKLLVIKQIHPRLSGQRHFVDLFVAEAKILVGLVHGNIVPVYELGVIGDTYFIAMEYIDGPSLFRLTEQLRIKGARMEPTLAAHIATKILDGLDYAHRKGDGIIHRDLSGRNVMLSRDGEVKLVDFGIAVTLGEGGDAAGDTPAGSFPYMSPEQVLRQPLTGQSDLFSAGILLWEMLAGERLFARADASATLQAVTDAELVPPSVHNPAVPGRLDEVVMKALARDRTERWQTAAEMLGALHRYLYSLDETPGARELGRLVARYCPPTTRRRPTETEASPAPQPAGDSPSTAVIPRHDVRQQSFATHVELAELLHPGDELASDAAGNATTAAVGPRDSDDPGLAHTLSPALALAEPPADPLAATVAPEPGADAGADAAEHTAALPARAQRPTPVPSSAKSDDDGAASADDPTGAGDSSNAVVYPRAVGIEAAAAIARSAPHITIAQRRPARRRIAALASVALIGALTAGAIALFRETPGQPKLALAAESVSSEQELLAHRAPGAPSVDPSSDPEPSGGVTSGSGDVALAAVDGGARPDARPRRPFLDAAPPRPPVDARPTSDARMPRQDARPPVDARPVPSPLDARPTDARLMPAPHDARVDARQPTRFDARRPEPRPEPRSTGTSQIKVGANPWGEVYLDGKLAGRTPMTLTVPAGRHEIEVAFPVGDPPRRETYRLDLDAGETRSVLADFTN